MVVTLTLRSSATSKHVTAKQGLAKTSVALSLKRISEKDSGRPEGTKDFASRRQVGLTVSAFTNEPATPRWATNGKPLR
jgi:hypothetical protein